MGRYKKMLFILVYLLIKMEENIASLQSIIENIAPGKM